MYIRYEISKEKFTFCVLSLYLSAQGGGGKETGARGGACSIHAAPAAHRGKKEHLPPPARPRVRLCVYVTQRVRCSTRNAPAAGSVPLYARARKCTGRTCVYEVRSIFDRRVFTICEIIYWADEII